MTEHKPIEDQEDSYDPRDYNDGPLSEEEIKALWIDPEKFEAACEDTFKRYKELINEGITSPPKPAAKATVRAYRPGRQMRFRS